MDLNNQENLLCHFKKLCVKIEGFSKNIIIIVFPNLKFLQLNYYVKIYSIKIM